MRSLLFLQAGGSLLVLIGMLGLVGITGPSPEKSMFGNQWWFDDVENFVHLILGLVALASALAFPQRYQRRLTFIIGLSFFLLAVYVLAGPRILWGAYLQYPWDSVVHGVFAYWALIAASTSDDPIPTA